MKNLEYPKLLRSVTQPACKCSKSNMEHSGHCKISSKLTIKTPNDVTDVVSLSNQLLSFPKSVHVSLDSYFFIRNKYQWTLIKPDGLKATFLLWFHLSVPSLSEKKNWFINSILISSLFMNLIGLHLRPYLIKIFLITSNLSWISVSMQNIKLTDPIFLEI